MKYYMMTIQWYWNDGTCTRKLLEMVSRFSPLESLMHLRKKEQARELGAMDRECVYEAIVWSMEITKGQFELFNEKYS